MVWYSHSFFYGILKLVARVILEKWVFANFQIWWCELQTMH
jgi:hypothetical protein